MQHIGVGHYATHGDVTPRVSITFTGAPKPKPKIGDVRILELRPGYWLRERFMECPCPDCRGGGHWAGEIAASRREQVEE